MKKDKQFSIRIAAQDLETIRGKTAGQLWKKLFPKKLLLLPKTLIYYVKFPKNLQVHFYC